MKYTLLLLCLPLALAAIEEKETIRQSYPAASRLEIRNINGSVRVIGSARSDFQVTIQKRIEGKSASDVDLAKREVRLDVDTTGSRLKLCVAGPWSDCAGDHKGDGCKSDCRRDYSVRFDFEIEAPAAIAAELRTVNGGVTARSLNGAVNARTVNGGITLEEVGAAGTAHTVNGGIKVSVTQSPTEAFDAKTVNGGIDVAFPRNLNGRLRFKTMHGDVFTNFPATAMPSQPVESEEKNGRRVYRSDRSFAVQVGAGGPEHRFETLNGTIQISER
ncbi:MAG: hypothetical protein JST93_00975 [Acidobacteria bacterium]|nr:hypothetical protein [Acidobacteriota bacterium]